MGPWELLNVVQKMYSGKGEVVLPGIREEGSGFVGVLDLWVLSCYTVDLSLWRNKLDEATPYSEEATPLGAAHIHTDCSSEEDEVEYSPTVADSKSLPPSVQIN